MDSEKCTCISHPAMPVHPVQEWCEPYDLLTALAEGTIFPCLNLTFFKAPEGKYPLKTSSPLSDKEQKSREEIMSRLSAISFAINDLTLYLDTHPNCANGLSLFYQLLDQRLALLSEFADKFYPLTQTSMITGNYNQSVYGWSKGPMPWEGACI